ncbi:MAG: hypothetical protein GC150_02570 [Rhizobiales bacterium]|nr:hypothetical protein [Hyphomicrobiales bacterium]
MRLNPPTVFVFLISLVLVGLAVVSHLGLIQVPFKFPNQNLWLAVSGYIILMIGNLVRGL